MNITYMSVISTKLIQAKSSALLDSLDVQRPLTTAYVLAKFSWLGLNLTLK